MDNTNHNHTDNFFRRGLSAPPEFSPSDKTWEAMERLLKPETKRRSLGWIYFTSGMAAAILVFTSWWLLSEPFNSPQQAKALKRARPAVSAENDGRASSSEGIEKDFIKNPEIFNSHLNEAGYAKGKTAASGHETIYTQTNSPGANNKGELSPAKYSVLKISPDANHNFEFKKVLGMAATTKELDNSSLTPQLTEETPERGTEPRKGKWALSMAVSPDFNSVSGVGQGTFGLSGGAGLSYKLGKTISIGTGIYYSQKLYSADKASYKVKEKPFATWTSYSNRIDADCRVIDIPVNLSVRVSNGKHTKLYASGGLSSYIMLSEKYDFIYNPSPAYPTGKREYSIHNQNKHILSVVNLSVAMEKPINNQMSLVLQPYAKLPLTGIGQGETDLKSLGLGFKLNYSLKKK